MDLLERAGLLDELSGVLAATVDGGRVVLLAGEAGIGKSALVRRFTERRPADARFLLGACDPLLTPRALGPLHDSPGRRAAGWPTCSPCWCSWDAGWSGPRRC